MGETYSSGSILERIPVAKSCVSWWAWSYDSISLKATSFLISAIVPPSIRYRGESPVVSRQPCIWLMHLTSFHNSRHHSHLEFVTWYNFLAKIMRKSLVSSRVKVTHYFTETFFPLDSCRKSKLNPSMIFLHLRAQLELPKATSSTCINEFPVVFKLDKI